MNFTLVELTKINLEPNEVLAVKLYGDDYDEDNVKSLKENLQQTFPNNKIMMFILPSGHDLQMEKVSANMENKELDKTSCSEPTSYCNDCACGKKERIEKQNE